MRTLSNFAEENFLQTDFNILFRLNNEDKYMRELVLETEYVENTVNTILGRLLKTNRITRYKNKAGMYLYSSLIKLDINTEQYGILDYLMTEHKRIMTPNACRIMCILLDKGKYSVQSLIKEKRWKPSALYKNTNKLRELGILVPDDGYFKLSPEIKERAAKMQVKDSITISTFNFNGYNKKLDTEVERDIEDLKGIISGNDIVALQEFKVGEDEKYSELLSEDNYEVILPIKYTEDNYKHTIAMLLIDKEIYKDYEQLSLAEDRLFPLRYTYGRLTMKNQKRIRILSLHIPQSYGIPQERRLVIKEFWREINLEARECRKNNEYFILLGDLNAFNGEESENRDSLRRLDDMMIDAFESAVKENPDWGVTWISKDGKTRRRLDYVFINCKVAYDYSIKCNVDDSTLDSKISDHKILEIKLRELP